MPDELHPAAETSHQNQIVLRLREMILRGELRPGQRVAEIPVAERLGVSRTPVRYALGILSREGLIVPTANRRGFLVREFTLKDIADAIQVRGMLEGAAARIVAEKGLSDSLDQELAALLVRGRHILDKGHLRDGDGLAWADTNERFHRLIVDDCGNRALAHALQINDKVPFSSAGAFLEDETNTEATERQYRVLYIAQAQHDTILRCLRNREGARVEALMREHSYAALENIMLFRAAMSTPLRAGTDEGWMGQD